MNIQTISPLKQPITTQSPMKFQIAALSALLTLSAAAAAAELHLAWDPSPTPGVTNYVLYASTNDFSAPTNLTAAAASTRVLAPANPQARLSGLAAPDSGAVRLNVGTNLTATIADLAEGYWSFAATAEMDGLESELSNIVHVQVPAPPANMRTVILQYSGTLSNFQDAVFFKLKLP